MFGFFGKRSGGVAILETAMTLPIVLYVIFFAIELIRVEVAQTAVDAITKECAFSLMAKGTYSDFDSIFRKYKPWGIPIGYFRYCCRLYPYMTSPDGGTTKGIMDVSPYGGESIGWYGEDYANPNPNITPVAQNPNGGSGSSSNDHATLSKYRTVFTVNQNYGEVAYIERRKLLSGEKSSSGYIFVLTVTVKFPFSSPFIAKLFNGGSNTDKGIYIIWARGSGMVNAD